MSLKKGLTIDVGHEGIASGFDPGAVNKTAGVIEADYNLKISLYQFNRFKELGVPVAITRTGDKRMTNKERTDLVKKLGYQDCISNHNNAGGGDGFEAIHSIHSDKKFEELCRDEIIKTGQNFRRIFSKTLPSNPKLDYYFMHRDTGSVKTTIIEYGFVDSPKDDIMQLKQNWQNMAEAIVKAYCLYRGYKYVAPNQKEEAPSPSIGGFKDIPNTHPFAKEIQQVSEMGLMVGVGDGLFAPDRPLTRGEMAVLLTRINKLILAYSK